MNSLSWLIYLAGVSDGLCAMFIISAVVLGFGALFAGLGYVVVYIDEPESQAKMSYALKWLLPSIFILGLLATILPSKDTVYAIAASEMGEQILKTPTAGKAFKALDAWLDKQTAPKADKNG